MRHHRVAFATWVLSWLLAAHLSGWAPADILDAYEAERWPITNQVSTFAMSRLDWAELAGKDHARWLGRYRRLLAIRTREIAPRLAGIPPFAGSYRVLGPKAVLVEWQLGDRSQLVLVANFADKRVPIPPMFDARLLYSSAEPDALLGSPLSAAFFLLAPAPQ